MRSTPLATRPELLSMITKAAAWFEALSPEQKREHRAAQRKSWVIGEFMLAHPEASREYAEQVYAKVG